LNENEHTGEESNQTSKVAPGKKPGLNKYADIQPLWNATSIIAPRGRGAGQKADKIRTKCGPVFGLLALPKRSGSIILKRFIVN
jgi:hypothetical protein